ncbi:MAG: serine hydrolase domain-containing protein [Aquihabitans sp.]
MDYPELKRVLEALVDHSEAHTAGYVSVRSGTTPLRHFDCAYGVTADGRPAHEDDLVPVGCATKPLLPLLLAQSAPHLLDAAISLAALGAGSRDHERALIDVTVDDLLTHRSGICSPNAIDWRLNGRSMGFDAFIENLTVNRERHTYSDFAAWVVLEHLFRKETGRDPADAIFEDILQPAGLGEDIVVSATELTDEMRERIAVPRINSRRGWVPLLSERVSSELELLRPAFGGIATCRGLADLMLGVMRVDQGEFAAGMPNPWNYRRMVSVRGPEIPDAHNRRTFRYRGGFMDRAGAEGVDGLSDSALGHVGGFGLCLVLEDPVNDLAMAFYLNGISDAAPELEMAKQTLLDAVLSAAVSTP